MEGFLAKVDARILSGIPEGYDALVLAERARGAFRDSTLHVARDELRLAALAEAVAYFAPDIEIIAVPAWDCLPYDRVSPRSDVVARRIDALTRLTSPPGQGQCRLVITTVSAILQRVPKVETLKDAALELKVRTTLDRKAFDAFLAANGYSRAEQVMKPASSPYAAGSSISIRPGRLNPCASIFFGDDVETIRTFDPVSQRTTGARPGMSLEPVSETVLTPKSITQYRTKYRELFGAAADNDALYESVSQGRKFLGQEHWLPLFHDGLGTIIDYCRMRASVSIRTSEIRHGAFRDDPRLLRGAARRCRQSERGQEGTLDRRRHRLSPGAAGDDVPRRSRLDDPAAWRASGGVPLLCGRGCGRRRGCGGRLGRDFADVRARPTRISTKPSWPM